MQKLAICAKKTHMINMLKIIFKYIKNIFKLGSIFIIQGNTEVLRIVYVT